MTQIERVLRNDKEDLRQQLEAAQKQLKDAQHGLISGFYEDGIPEFRQGPPTHELQSLVTAEEVNAYVKRIHELLSQLQHAQEDLASARQAAAKGWQPIGTEPKDGTYFLAYVDAHTVYVASWYCGVLTARYPYPIKPTHWRPHVLPV